MYGALLCLYPVITLTIPYLQVVKLAIAVRSCYSISNESSISDDPNEDERIEVLSSCSSEPAADRFGHC